MKNRDTPVLGYNGSDKSNFLMMGFFWECKGKGGFQKCRGGKQDFYLAVLGTVHFKWVCLVHLG